MMGITQRQSELLEFLRTHFAAHSLGPTYNEVRIAMGWRSKALAYKAILALIARGYVRHGLAPRCRIELVETEGHNPTHCFCDWCNAMRVRTAQTFIQALHVPAEILAGTNFKALGGLDRMCWKAGFPKPAHPETRKPKAKMQPAEVYQ